MRSFVLNIVLSVFPPSHCFSLKSRILRFFGVKVGKNVHVMRIRISSVSVQIGHDTFIGDKTVFTGADGTSVYIGNNCDISSHVHFVTGTHKIGSIERAAGEGYGKSIRVGDGSWIGYGSIILPGVSIGRGSIVAAGSVVLSDVPDGTLVAGVPAIVKKQVF